MPALDTAPDQQQTRGGLDRYFEISARGSTIAPQMTWADAMGLVVIEGVTTTTVVDYFVSHAY